MGQLAGFEDKTVSFARRLARSGAFKALFNEGMGLVEESAAYLDGKGREDSKGLGRPQALAYATESMRLTTRLMQLASWLLLQRAVNEGEMTPAQAAAEKHRVRLSRQEIASAPETFEQMPARLRDLCTRSLRLQDRILHLDRSIQEAKLGIEPRPAAPTPVARQWETLRDAFGPAAAVNPRS
ncbi:MAG: DUF1465 family protein [Hyphomicrobiales bacterium]|nr:DUF1465 family protein [Hyphomicrobiales bacterium]MDE2017678.1 DUF1465 family protein [Hyphomicrobiales bacterium]